MRRKLRRIKSTLKDVKDTLLRGRVPVHQGLLKQGLEPYQIYPKGGNLNFAFITSPIERYPKIIYPDTPIAAIGSCFSVEIKSYLDSHGFNFIQTEDSSTNLSAGSADWGRVYTSKNLLQIFQYSFGEFSPEIQSARADKGVFDPYREGRIYPTQQEADQAITKHRMESRAALSACKVLIITPGQNEAWINRSDGLAWAHPPPPEFLSDYGPDNFYLKRFSLSENVEYLNQTLNILWENNPDSKVILTLSPIPSYATFTDVNVVSRSIENKAILLLAVKEVINQHPGKTYYFPSFEMAMLSHNANLQLDNRHVRFGLVEKIMSSFDDCFVTSNVPKP